MSIMDVKVLDHGYVRLIETWGSDERIVEAARMSTDKSFRHWGMEACPFHVSVGPMAHCKECRGDEGLLKYLYDHKHMTPFEMGGMTIEVQAPIFVFREWHRHRTQSYNELSARYTPLPDVNYVPTIERLMMSGGANKQAGTVEGADALTRESAQNFIETLEAQYATLQTLYQANLDAGVPKELARLVIPVGRYSRMRASANLRNWLGFLTLRTDKAAQWEIRQYANVVADMVSGAFPRTFALFQG